MLKWASEERIKPIINNKKITSYQMELPKTFDYELEKDLYYFLYSASENSILDINHLKIWIKANYKDFYSLFDKDSRRQKELLESKGYIHQRTSNEENKKIFVMNDIIYEDSRKLYGLKLYLEHFSIIKEKEIFDVKLWNEYLMYAYLFGIAKEVEKSFGKINPELINNDNMSLFHFISDVVDYSITTLKDAKKQEQNIIKKIG